MDSLEEQCHIGMMTVQFQGGNQDKNVTHVADLSHSLRLGWDMDAFWLCKRLCLDVVNLELGCPAQSFTCESILISCNCLCQRTELLLTGVIHKHKTSFTSQPSWHNGEEEYIKKRPNAD